MQYPALLSLLVFVAILPTRTLSQAELTYDLRLNTVPLGFPAQIRNTTTSLELQSIALSNPTTSSTATVEAFSWFEFLGTNTIANVANSSGSNFAGTGLFVDDSLILSGDNPGDNATIEFELEIEGTFDLVNGTIPASGGPKFEGIAEFRLRSQSSRFFANRTVTASLRDIVNVPPRPRVESDTFPFTVRSVATHLIKVGEAFSLDLDFSSSASVTFGDFSGPPPESGQFGTVTNLHHLVTTARARIIRINILNNGVVNPVLTSTSGTDYSPLLRQPEALRFIDFQLDRGSGRLILEWETPSRALSFRIRQAPDLTMPPSQWAVLAETVARQSSITRYQTDLPLPLDPECFFIVEEK